MYLQESDRPGSSAVCNNLNLFEEPFSISQANRMSLLEEVKRVAAEFEYPPDEVNKGVKEFIRQMGQFRYVIWVNRTC